MGKGTKVVAHEGIDTGTSIFYKCEYEEGHYSTLPIASENFQSMNIYIYVRGCAIVKDS